MRIVKMQNTLFFVSDVHNIALAYYVLRFRKRNNPNKLNVLRKAWKRARSLEKKLPVESSNYVSLLLKAKQNKYSNRIDLDRPVESVIHPIVETQGNKTLAYSWALVMRGLGTSVYSGKPIKPIVCKEKIRKVAKEYIDLLSDLVTE